MDCIIFIYLLFNPNIVLMIGKNNNKYVCIYIYIIN